MNIVLFDCNELFIEDWEPVITGGIKYDRQ